jgi:hypothetical protein
MKRQIKYISERGMSFDTAEAATAHDQGLPGIIATWKADLVRMETDTEFGGQPVTEDLKKYWRRQIAMYEAAWKAAQRSLPTYQQRVRDEKADLDEKLGKLEAFIGTMTYVELPVEERSRLYRQRRSMADYSEDLGERIAAFGA